MTSFVRPYIVSLLCGVVALGHATAWLHVADCEHEGHHHLAAQANAAELEAAHHDHHHECCHHGDEAAGESQRLVSEESHHSHGSHDSGACLICQSLGLANGVDWHLDALTIVRADSGVARISAVILPESTFLSIPQPRGPPAPLA
ncbi:hypothetical protein [Roseimaritima ulvae]|uniref:Cobalt-zinc-cadmium resistance protein CzcI n=1 Tax=Roseimaritima ulvae TaxID=980254 RepID=A0A5B9QPA0_9BACT|nr:hypothetical protein [Roseimaritima ulvae]QEG40848.1 hypothetical protein UC8_28660 [Roseimaritima ulvae]